MTDIHAGGRRPVDRDLVERRHTRKRMSWSAPFAGRGALGQRRVSIVAPCIAAAAAALGYTALRPVGSEARMATRAATEALPTGRVRRVDAALADPPVPPKS